MQSVLQGKSSSAPLWNPKVAELDVATWIRKALHLLRYTGFSKKGGGTARRHMIAVGSLYMSVLVLHSKNLRNMHSAYLSGSLHNFGRSALTSVLCSLNILCSQSELPMHAHLKPCKLRGLCVRGVYAYALAAFVRTSASACLSKSFLGRNLLQACKQAKQCSPALKHEAAFLLCATSRNNPTLSRSVTEVLHEAVSKMKVRKQQQ